MDNLTYRQKILLYSIFPGLLTGVAVHKYLGEKDFELLGDIPVSGVAGSLTALAISEYIRRNKRMRSRWYRKLRKPRRSRKSRRSRK